ncbi:MAG: alpha-ketoglutarate-dependent dioxygenase AlkB [Eikenella sp.]|nr:alpha-ketoglutarate-dependent dioxygenase AlkB [Eikenella sp.]
MMPPTLFPDPGLPEHNLLPYDGQVCLLNSPFSAAEADHCLHSLLQDIAWQHDQVRLYGKTVTTGRQTAWYGDSGLHYTYSGITRSTRPWTPLLLAIKQRVEAHTAAVCAARFNSCLLNLYADGRQGMTWHSDDEAGLDPLIASLSFGATRRFAFRHKRTREKRILPLAHGQLLLMYGSTQQHWQHALLKNTGIGQPRINLTFRTIRNCPARRTIPDTKGYLKTFR